MFKEGDRIKNIHYDLVCEVIMVTGWGYVLKGKNWREGENFTKDFVETNFKKIHKTCIKL